MKCSNADCNRGIGLVSYRRGLFGKRPYCSKRCRDALVAREPKPQQRSNDMTYVEWLFLRPIEHPQLELKPALIRAKAR